MDITFETEKGTDFTIEVGYWDTIAEVKVKVQMYMQIPVSQQTLVFQGIVLNDDLDIMQSELVPGSRVSLIIAANNEQPPISRHIHILLRRPSIAPMVIDLDDTVEKLKHKINEMEGGLLPINQIVLHEELGIEMQDSNKIRDYNLKDGSEVHIYVKPDNSAQLSPTAVPATLLSQFIPPRMPPPQFKLPAMHPPLFTSPVMHPPQFKTPEMPLPQFTSPVMLPPQFTSTQFTSPEMPLPQFTSPEMPLPQFTSPVMPSPQFTSPEIPLPQFTSPAMPLPQFTSPEMHLPQFTSPAMPPPPQFTSPALTPLQFKAPAMPPPQFTLPPTSRRIQILLRASTGQIASIEIDLEDTVERLKHNINEMEGASIPINLIVLREPLANIEMQDRQKIRDYHLTDGSEVGISVKAASELSTTPATMAQPSSTAAEAISRRIQILFKPVAGRRQMAPMEIDVDDTVERLKHKIKEREGATVPINRIVLREPLGLIEMLDCDKIREYHLTDGAEVDISVKPPTVASSSSSSRKLKINVHPHEGDKIPMEFNPADKIQVIRRDLKRLKQIKEFELPSEYFFIHDQSLMEEDKPFLWHRVRQGDTIILFPGSVTSSDR